MYKIALTIVFLLLIFLTSASLYINYVEKPAEPHNKCVTVTLDRFFEKEFKVDVCKTDTGTYYSTNKLLTRKEWDEIVYPTIKSLNNETN